jgi:hypothetical protein
MQSEKNYMDALRVHKELTGAYRVILDALLGEPRDPNEDPRTKALLLNMVMPDAARAFDAMKQAGYIAADETRPELHYGNGELVRYTMPAN